MIATAGPDVERYVTILGRPVRIRVRGEGRPLLLINGLGANVSTWGSLLKQLDGFQVISFDAPGVGRSPSPVAPYTIARIANVARQVLDATDLEQADVLGYSLGGSVAQRLAFEDPDRVRRLVLVSSSCGVGGIPGSLSALLAVSTPARHYATLGSRLAVRMIDLAPAEKESRYIQQQTAMWLHDGAPSVLGYALQMTAFTTFHSLPWLHRISQPTLLLSGSADRLIPVANSAILAARLQQARLRVFERWGHYLLHDPASGAGATVADFLGAENHAGSSAWIGAMDVNRKALAEFIGSAPRSAHPASLTSGLWRRLYPLPKDVD